MLVMMLRGPGEIAEDEAGPELARTYARLRELLGVPFVPTVYRMLGRHERYLTAAVGALSELLSGSTAERFAGAARKRGAEAAAQLHAPPLVAGQAKGRAMALVERYNTANPRSLLFACALLPAPPSGTVVMAAPVISPAPADAADAILRDIGELHGGQTVPGFWRELAGCPEVLGPAWSAIRPLAGTPLLGRSAEAIAAMAREATAGVRVTAPEALRLSSDDRQQIASVLTWFTEAIATMIVEIECVRRLLRSDASHLDGPR